MQFGLAYGVANKAGQPTLDTARALVGRARASGIDTLDTAIAYGDAERRLGEIGVQGLRIVTKLPPVPAECADVDVWARSCVNASLTRLRVRRVDGLLLHRSADLLRPDGDRLYRAMGEMQDAGLIGKIGVSIYAPAELDAIWPRFPGTMVQAPFNVVDRRLSDSGWLERLAGEGVELHTRSAFLQGLLLMQDADRPIRFRRWQAIWDAWHRWLSERQTSATRACLEFVLAQSAIDRVIVGVDTVDQLDEILSVPEKPSAPAPDAVRSTDLDLIDPSRWNAA